MKARLTYFAMIAGIATTATLSGCATSASEVAETTSPVATSEATPTAPEWGGVATYETMPDEGSLLAAGGGILVVENGCVRLDSGVVPVFPADQVSWDGTTLTWAGEEYSVGDTLRFGGGLANETDEQLDIPAECGGGDAWIINPRPSVESPS